MGVLNNLVTFLGMEGDFKWGYDSYTNILVSSTPEALVDHGMDACENFNTIGKGYGGYALLLF